MGVTEIAPGLYWSSIETDNGKIEIDLGCYSREGPAGVAHDLMAFKLHSSSGEQRRLPQVEEELLVLSMSDYEKIARDIIKELKRSTEELAVALKSKGLAEQLHNFMETGRLPPQLATAAAPVAVAAEAKPKPAAAKRAVEPSKKVLAPAEKRQKTAAKEEEKPPPVVLLDSSEEEEEEAEEEVEEIVEEKPAQKKSKKKKEESKPKAEKKVEKKAETKDTSDGPHIEISRGWLKGSTEFPPGSGKHPCYAKEKHFKHGLFTIAQDVVKSILSDCVHGNIEVVSVEDPYKTWNMMYNIKDVVHRVPGDYKGPRYFTQIAQVKKSLDLKDGAVIYFMKGEEPQQVKIGLWLKGSEEAEAFTQRLLKDQPGAK